MSTEQKPPVTTPTHTEPKGEPNALAQALTGSWDKFKQGKLISYSMMGIILLIVVGIGVTWWIIHERNKLRSAMWVELDAQTGSPTGLEEFAKKNPNTIQAKLAMLEVARLQLGAEGIDRMNSTDPGARKTAIENIEKAREAFPKLVDEFKDDPVIRVQCMLACAKAEAVLVGMPKEGQLEQRRGAPAKAIEWLDKVAAEAPDTDWGKDAKKLSETLKNQNTQEQVVTLQAMVYVVPTLPDPKLDPRMPRDPSHGFPGP